jgi:hypothetical protein
LPRSHLHSPDQQFLAQPGRNRITL